MRLLYAKGAAVSRKHGTEGRAPPGFRQLLGSQNTVPRRYGGTTVYSFRMSPLFNIQNETKKVFKDACRNVKRKTTKKARE